MRETKSDFVPTRPRTPLGSKPVGRVVGNITRGVMRRRGFRDVAILDNWPAIVGPQLAHWSQPVRLSQRGAEGGVLTIRVEGAMALEVQHLAPMIMERVNTYYGHNTVRRLAIQQGPVVPLTQAKSVAEPDAESVASAHAALDGLEDGPLKHALARLGARMQARGKDGGAG